MPGVCCPIRNNHNLEEQLQNNKFVSSVNFLKPNNQPDNQTNFNKPPIYKPPPSNKPISFLTESSNQLDSNVESSTKNPWHFFTTPSMFSPFKDYFSTEKKVFFKDKYTTPASTLNEIENTTFDHKNSSVSDVEKTLYGQFINNMLWMK